MKKFSALISDITVWVDICAEDEEEAYALLENEDWTKYDYEVTYGGYVHSMDEEGECDAQNS